jgi:hypothetical protein
MLKRKITCLLIISLVLLIAMDVSARTFTLQNSSGASRTFHYLPGGNAWSVGSGGSVNVSVGDGTAAMRFWCDYGIQSPPCNSLAEFTLNGAGNQDFYDVSFVDGYNLAMKIQPSLSCGAPGTLNTISCPSALQTSGSCCSACMKFNTDQYCCRGAYGNPSTCPPTSYSLIFHNYCGNCYSYAYDDTAATFTCGGNPNYTITFGGPMGGASSTTTTASSTTTTASTTTTTSSTTSTTAAGGVITVQAENWSAMSGVATEACSEGGLNVGWIETGDWMAYNVNVPSAKSYLFTFRVASPNSGTRISVDYNAGAVVVGVAAVPNTGGWQNWQNCTMSGNLPAGAIALGLYAATGGYNVNWFSFQ